LAKRIWRVWGVLGVIEGKSELYHYLSNNDKLAVNLEDPIQVERSKDLSPYRSV
jgi:UDP-N-acetylmuramoyl-tripeptide--D-alanyl-D-alanine ligase